MLDEYRLKAMTIGDYIDDVYERKIKSDQAVQRAFCWSNEAINNLVYSTLSKKRIYIPNVILAEENNDNGTIKTYIVDGGQRTEALARFIKEGHKISKSIRNRYVEYQTNKKDKDGNLILDDDGDPISELVTYDLVGKTFDDLPPELKKRIIGGNLAAAIYQDCTPDETSELVLLYNSTVGMTVSQKSLTYVGRFADKIKKIKENRFLIDGTMLNEREKKNGEWERAIFECVMAMFYLDDWKKDPKKICAYLNENAKENDFNTLNEYFTKLIPYSDKLKNIEVAEVFIKKDMMAWMTFVKRMVELEISDEEIGEFLLAFNDLKEEEINGTTWIELDQNKHTKDKKVIVEKINYLTTLALEYLHKKPENFDRDQKDNICETENSDEDSDDADVENNTFIDGFNNFFSYDMDYLLQILLCTVCITVCEYYVGITVNKDFIIWDYRNMPWNLNGQICPTFSLVWAGLSAISIPILDWIEWRIFKYKPETPPYYKVFGHKIFQMGRKK